VTSPPRLLVALHQRSQVGTAIDGRLPGIPWGYLDATPPSDRGDVKALLVGSLEREFPDFDPTTTPKLAFVQRVYTGLDGFPFGRFPPQVRIAGNVGAFASPVAEQAVALALAAARQIVAVQPLVAEGRLRPPPEQRTLDGATALILGYGEIGREIARRLVGFGVTVTGLNRGGRMAPGCVAMYPADRLNEALEGADLVFDARPLTRATRGSIGAKELERMRPEAIYVNIGRAATVDEAALFRHLENHPGFRAGIDPWWHEHFATATFDGPFPFWKLSNFVGTPHSAGLVPGTEERALRMALENLARYFETGAPRNIVDRGEYDG
jgi:phosphoglycerate dehydrogenase-like enzyme